MRLKMFTFNYNSYISILRYDNKWICKTLNKISSTTAESTNFNIFTRYLSNVYKICKLYVILYLVYSICTMDFFTYIINIMDWYARVEVIHNSTLFILLLRLRYLTTLVNKIIFYIDVLDLHPIKINKYIFDFK